MTCTDSNNDTESIYRSVDANPTYNPKKSGTARKQVKAAPSIIHIVTSHKPSSRMIAGTGADADAGTKTSSNFVEPISFATVEEHILEDISLSRKHFDIHIKKCCEEFEKNPQKPVVVFTNVNDPDMAMELWEESDYGNKIMVTSNNELVYYEQTSDLHEAIAGWIVEDIHSYLRDIETSADNGPIKIKPFIQYLGSGRTKG